MDNSTLIAWAVVVMILWVAWIGYLVIKKLRGEAAMGITEGDLFDFIRK